MTNEERRSTAIHEAGHVVVAWTLGLPAGSMEIGCNCDDTAGASQIDDAAFSLCAVDRIALCAAGLEAQRLFECESTHEHAGAEDFAMIIGILDELPDEEADIIRFKGYDRAFKILDQRRSQVEKIAEALAASGRLEQDLGPLLPWRVGHPHPGAL
jgi:hypothetical protein